MGTVLFIEDVGSYNIPNDSFVARMSSTISSKKELLQDMKDKLQFPDYFGQNWDAAYDCFCDFAWIGKTNIVVIYDTCPSVDIITMQNFFNLIKDVAKSWDDTDEHNVFFVLSFPII